MLIVCDISDPQFREQLEAVEKVLHEIGASNHEKIYIFNKIDKGQVISDELLEAAYPNHIKISASNNTNLDILLTKISEIMNNPIELSNNFDTAESSSSSGSSNIVSIKCTKALFVKDMKMVMKK